MELAHGSGWRISFQIRGKNFLVRLMTHSRIRSLPYLRISVNTKSINALGMFCDVAELTHIAMEADVLGQVLRIIQNFFQVNG